MRFDITRLPVGGALIGLLLAAVILTFVGAFIAVEDGEGEGELVLGSPTPAAGTPGPGGTPAAGQAFQTAMVPTLKFDKAELRVPANTQVTVRADNRDTGIIHNLAAYTDSSAKKKIAATELCAAPCVKEVTFTSPAPGEYFFRCDVHPDMKGKLIAE